MQRDLFPTQEEPDTQTVATLFADVVFDRPLDHAFTYAVGDELRDRIAVGKRVRAPFGRGDKPAVGYCIHLSETAPPRAVKELVGVVDEDVLLDEHLLRLGVIYRFLQRKGFAYGEERAEFERALAEAKGADKAPPVLDMSGGGRRVGHRVPEGNWNLS